MDMTLDYRIRVAREADREEIAAMWIEFLDEQAQLDARFVVAGDALTRWRNDFAEWIGSTVHGLFVAETEEQRLIAFASVQLWYPAPIYEPELESYLNELYVRTDWRRCGVGTALLSEVRKWSKAKGAARIRLGVLSANESGRAFWAKGGGKPFFTSWLIEV